MSGRCIATDGVRYTSEGMVQTLHWLGDLYKKTTRGDFTNEKQYKTPIIATINRWIGDDTFRFHIRGRGGGMRHLIDPVN